MEISETSESGGLNRVRAAAERARRDLLRQLAEEAERLDREIGQRSERVIDEAWQLTEDRVGREVDRLQEASSNLSLELHRQLREGSERYGALLGQRLEASGAELREEVLEALENHRAGSERRIDQRLEAAVRTLSQRNADWQAELASAEAAARERLLAFAETNAAEGIRLREEAELVRRAHSDVDDLHAELGHLAVEIRNAAGRAQAGVIETARLAEESAKAQLESTAAEMLQNLRSVAERLGTEPEPEAASGGGERLDRLLARLQTADQRLRESDDRTRRALRRLRGP